MRWRCRLGWHKWGVISWTVTSDPFGPTDYIYKCDFCGACCGPVQRQDTKPVAPAKEVSE